MRFALHSEAQDTLAAAPLQYDLGEGMSLRNGEPRCYLFAGAFHGQKPDALASMCFEVEVPKAMFS
jgi:hypothetical protein